MVSAYIGMGCRPWALAAAIKVTAVGRENLKCLEANELEALHTGNWVIKGSQIGATYGAKGIKDSCLGTRL